MAEIHDLIIQHGREAARDLVPANQRHLVDAAADILTSESNALGYSYSGFALTALPHRKLPDDEVWERRGHRVTLSIEPGRLRVNGVTKKFGVPYGARARMILIYLQTQAIITGSREVSIGRSMRDWLEKMGIAVGGETAKAFRDQSRRISAAHLKFYWDGENGSEGFEKGDIIKRGLTFGEILGDDKETRQQRLWEDTVVIDEEFFRMLREHPVPLLDDAIKALKEKSLALDTYIWMAYRLHSLSKPTPVSWAAVMDQFGGGFKKLSHFKPHFIETLQHVISVYPEARIAVADEGLVLHPSRPPVAKLIA